MMTMTAFLGAIESGTIYAILALGIFLSFRTLNMPDLTVDGSIVTGMAASAVICTAGGNPFISLIGAALAGAVAGLATGILHTKLKIQAILAGILVMLASYSINLRIMGKTPNVPLTQTDTIYDQAEKIFPREYAGILLGVIILAAVIFLLYMFLRTRLGFVFRATGDNEDMVRAAGVSGDSMKVMGFAISNGFVGLAGGMLAQNQGFADINSGTGMMVIGLANVIIGTQLFSRLGGLKATTAVIAGAIIYRACVAAAINAGLEPGDMKLITAVLFLVIIAAGNLRKNRAARRARSC